MKFRDLKANEIDVRVATVKDNGVSLLLYKDARCDMNILDETVGPMNWERHHTRDNANCTVSIWDKDKGQWISKEDTGTESYTEKEKGLASDSFKRACFNWGIGRELYTAPFIWVTGCTKYDRFKVKEIEIEDKQITALMIVNKKNKQVVFTFKSTNGISNEKVKALTDRFDNNNIDADKVKNLYRVSSLEELTENQHININTHFDEIKEKCKKDD